MSSERITSSHDDYVFGETVEFHLLTVQPLSLSRISLFQTMCKTSPIVPQSLVFPHLDSAAYLDQGGDSDILEEIHEELLFFQTTLNNAALSLARTEIKIAAQYADLAENPFHKEFSPHIETEYETAASHVLDITERDDLVDRSWLCDNLDRRNPNVDPLNYLQVDLLDRTCRTDQAERTLRLTVKGIAAGMKNTGRSEE